MAKSGVFMAKSGVLWPKSGVLLVFLVQNCGPNKGKPRKVLKCLKFTKNTEKPLKTPILTPSMGFGKGFWTLKSVVFGVFGQLFEPFWSLLPKTSLFYGQECQNCPVP